MFMWILSQKYKKPILAIVGAILILGIGISSWRWYTHRNIPTFKKEYRVVLTDYEGNDVKLSQFKNTVLIAYVWASWCPYCGAEIENLARLKETYGDEVQVIAINRAEPVTVAKEFTDALQKTEGVVFLLDPTDSFFRDIGGYAMPETVFIRPNGEILLHQRGPIQFPKVEEETRKLLQKE